MVHLERESLFPRTPVSRRARHARARTRSQPMLYGPWDAVQLKPGLVPEAREQQQGCDTVRIVITVKPATGTRKLGTGQTGARGADGKSWRPHQSASRHLSQHVQLEFSADEKDAAGQWGRGSRCVVVKGRVWAGQVRRPGGG